MTISPQRRTELHRALTRRKQRRSAAAAVLVLAPLGAVLWLSLPSTNTPPASNAPIIARALEGAINSELPIENAAETQTIAQTASLIKRHTLEDTGPKLVRKIDDTELLDLLSEAGQPSGFIQYRGSYHIFELASNTR